MPEAQAIATSPTTDDWTLQPEDRALMERMDKLFGVAATPNLPADLALRVLDRAWALLGGNGQAASEPRHTA